MKRCMKLCCTPKLIYRIVTKKYKGRVCKLGFMLIKVTVYETELYVESLCGERLCAGGWTKSSQAWALAKYFCSREKLPAWEYWKPIGYSHFLENFATFSDLVGCTHISLASDSLSIRCFFAEEGLPKDGSGSRLSWPQAGSAKECI